MTILPLVVELRWWVSVRITGLKSESFPCIVAGTVNADCKKAAELEAVERFLENKDVTEETVVEIMQCFEDGDD